VGAARRWVLPRVLRLATHLHTHVLREFSWGIFYLPNNIGQKCHVAGTLDGLGQGALTVCREISAAAREDFTVWINEFTQRLNVFIIDTAKLWCVIVFGHIVFKFRMECRLD
jgi:hypothetical protein